MSRSSLLLASVLLAFASGARAADLEIEAQLEPQVARAGESVYLTIEVRGGGFGRLAAEPEYRLENLETSGQPSHAESFRLINGVMSRTLVIRWRLRALAPGPAAARDLRVRVRDQVFELGDREIEVRASDADGRDPAPDPGARPLGDEWLLPRDRGLRFPSREPKIFLRAEVTPESPWAGEQALYTLHLYTQGDVNSVQPQALPTFRGFWVHEVPQAQRLRPDMVLVEGERYARIVLLQRALFPLGPGPLEIEPAVAEVALTVPEVGFLGGFFRRVEPRQLRSNALTVVARPLPPPPPGWSGAVGQLALETRLEPAEVPVGEAATLTITLSGEGHLQGLPEPALQAPAGVRLFPPQQEGSQEVAARRVRGRRSWSFVLIPERRGRFSLPPVEVPYFDPLLSTYRMAAGERLELAAGPAAGTLEPSAAVAASGAPHPVRSAALPAPAPAAWPRLLPWAFALPWVLGATLLWARSRAGRAPGAAQARRHLEERLRQAAGEERPRAAAAQVEDGWRAYLDERWRLPPGVASTLWAQELAARGADAGAAAELVRLADDLHYLRYAPQLSSTGTLQLDLVARSRRLLRALR